MGFLPDDTAVGETYSGGASRARCILSPPVGAHYVLPPCTNHLHFRKMYVACGGMAFPRWLS